MREVQDKFLRWKGLKYLFMKDKHSVLLKHFFRHPVVYSWRLLKTYFFSKPYKIDRGMYLYNINSFEEFFKLLENQSVHLIIGISYCQKPLKCPSGRFNTECICDADNSACKECFVKSVRDKFPVKRCEFLLLTTVHYVGDEILKILHDNPERKNVFAICACPLSLQMFADWSNVIGLSGVGVPLSGSICRSMKAFEYAEKGNKPMQTMLSTDFERYILSLLDKINA